MSRWLNKWGCILVILLLSLMVQVSLQITIEAVTGGSVVLPCSSAEPQLNIEDITVDWKQDDNLYVYSITKGNSSPKDTYINRAETFTEEYLKGNFSLKINNLQYSDKGEYQCLINHESEIKTVELFIEVPQKPIVGVTGGSVVLPCSSNARQTSTEDITVSWRHNKTLHVSDIIKGKISKENLHSAFKNRTQTFTEEYLNGNFSLKLNNLQYDDSGRYMCYITNELVIQSVQLEINSSNRGAQPRPEKILLLVPLLYL